MAEKPTTDTFSRSEQTAHGGRASGRLTWTRNRAGPTIHGLRVRDDGRPIDVFASESFLKASGLSTGKTARVFVRGQYATVRIAGSFRYFPTYTPPGSDSSGGHTLLVADLHRTLYALNTTPGGVVPVASFFSPVRRVKYKTEYTRVGQLTNYDKLILEIWTNGTVTPEMALVEASKILRKHLNPFINYFDVGKELAQPAIAKQIICLLSSSDPEVVKKAVHLCAWHKVPGAEEGLRAAIARGHGPLEDLAETLARLQRDQPAEVA